MTIVKFSIRRDNIRAALLFAATSDIRYYLNGLYFESYADGLFLVGTDGHRLGVFKELQDYARCAESGTKGVSFTVPRSLLDAVKTNKSVPLVGIEYDTETRKVTLTDGNSTSTVTAEDGRYPDFRRVIPEHISGMPCQINMTYLADFAKVTKALGRKEGSGMLFYNGALEAKGTSTGSVRLEIAGEPGFVGVIMGMRGMPVAPSFGTLAFLTPPASVEQPEALAA